MRKQYTVTSLIAGKTGEVWLPTMEFRWIRIPESHDKILQQKWENIKGESKWEEIPTVE
jgi:hypothetical protein